VGSGVGLHDIYRSLTGSGGGGEINSDVATYWPEEKFENRYHAQSVAISARHPRKEVLMEVVLERARDEGVAIGLEASPEGERLYTALGFKLKEKFRNQIEGEEEGAFVWEPPGWERVVRTSDA
jgi:hypothetical protein